MMRVVEARMTDERPSGEERLRQRRRRYWLIIGSLALAGFIPGLLAGYTQGEAELGAGAVWPAWIAILLSVIYVAAVIAGGYAMHRQMDELELRNRHKAATAAGCMLMIVYPVWFFLWMGDLAPEPIHWVLFALFYLTLIGYDLYYRYK